MSKELDSKRNPFNVITRLMGLDEVKGTNSCHSSRVTLASVLQNCRQLERDSPSEKMALVRQKFMEAKKMATDEELVKMATNKDILLKLLEEPNSTFSKHLKELHSKSTAPQTSRITVLKPLSPMSQPTKIVVLKPRMKITDNDSFESSDLFNEVSCEQRDELSSVFSNGYSFSRSENEYTEEETITPYSPEPFVIREAKKQLSERCALARKQVEVRRISCTLGEMLGIPEIKKDGDDRERSTLIVGNHDKSSGTSNKKPIQNQDQPSPTSVLDVLFGHDSDTPNHSAADKCKLPLTVSPIKKLSWDDSETSTSVTAHQVQSIISAADLDNENLETVFTRFHSNDSPLDPKLRETFSRFLFDYVNATLLEISQTMYPWTAQKKVQDDVSVATKVWLCMEEKLSYAANTNVVRVDVDGSGWEEAMWLEIDFIKNKISGDILEDLVTEAF